MAVSFTRSGTRCSAAIACRYLALPSPAIAAIIHFVLRAFNNRPRDASDFVKKASINCNTDLSVSNNAPSSAKKRQASQSA